MIFAQFPKNMIENHDKIVKNVLKITLLSAKKMISTKSILDCFKEIFFISTHRLKNHWTRKIQKKGWQILFDSKILQFFQIPTKITISQEICFSNTEKCVLLNSSHVIFFSRLNCKLKNDASLIWLTADSKLKKYFCKKKKKTQKEQHIQID